MLVIALLVSAQIVSVEVGDSCFAVAFYGMKLPLMSFVIN